MNRNPWPSSVFSPAVRAELARAAGQGPADIHEVICCRRANKGQDVI
jgi:hypothetical protein